MGTDLLITLQKEFIAKMGISTATSFNQETIEKVSSAQIRLIREELGELVETLENRDPLKEVLKEYTDLLYVVIGLGVRLNFPVEEAYKRVHSSNMSKLVDGVPLRDQQGKILKGPNYVPPDLEDLLDG